MEQQTEQKLEEMTFRELWDYMNEKTPSEWFKVRAMFEKEFSINDAALRHKKRTMNFRGVERRFITDFLKEFYSNEKIKTDVLFPNNPERFVNDFYYDLMKTKQAVL